MLRRIPDRAESEAWATPAPRIDTEVNAEFAH